MLRPVHPRSAVDMLAVRTKSEGQLVSTSQTCTLAPREFVSAQLAMVFAIPGVSTLRCTTASTTRCTSSPLPPRLHPDLLPDLHLDLALPEVPLPPVGRSYPVAALESSAAMILYLVSSACISLTCSLATKASGFAAKATAFATQSATMRRITSVSAGSSPRSLPLEEAQRLRRGLQPEPHWQPQQIPPQTRPPPRPRLHQLVGQSQPAAARLSAAMIPSLGSSACISPTCSLVTKASGFAARAMGFATQFATMRRTTSVLTESSPRSPPLEQAQRLLRPPHPEPPLRLHQQPHLFLLVRIPTAVVSSAAPMKFWALFASISRRFTLALLE